MSAETTTELPEHVIRAKESLKLTSRWAYGSAVVGMAMMTQSSWWVLAAAIFFLIAIIGSIVVMTKLPAARAHRSEWFFAVLLLCSCGYFLLGAIGQLIFFDQMNTYADCLQHALTQSRMRQCNTQLEDSMLGTFLGR